VITPAPEDVEVSTRITLESVFADEVQVFVTVRVTESPGLIDVALADTVKVSSVTAADEGATERTPRPNAATATSAIRLKVVFVDILFLSVVVKRTFPLAALR
jgi:hypothetical protein